MNTPAIELYDPDVYAASVPHEAMRWLRDNAPVYWHAHPDGGGFWIISRHADVVAVSRDHKTFSAERGFVMVDELPPEILAETRNQLLGMDPPRHAPLRRIVIERFTQRMLEQLEPRVRKHVKVVEFIGPNIAIHFGPVAVASGTARAHEPAPRRFPSHGGAPLQGEMQ